MGISQKQHATGELAMQHALATQTRYGIRRVYQCKHCNQWHLTVIPTHLSQFSL